MTMPSLLNHKNRLIALAILLSLILLVAAIRSSRAPHSPGPETAPTHARAQEEYVCPMHPQIRQDKPGSCPICGMDLVKTDSAEPSAQDSREAPAGHAPFALPENRQQMIGVKFGRAEKKALFKEIEAAGRVAYDPELYTAQNEYLEAIQQLERTRQSPIEDVKQSAKRMVESAKLRLKILGLSDQQIQSLRTDENAGTNLLIPQPGESIWIYAEVYEMDVPFVKPGMEVSVTGSALGATKLTGRVAAIDRVLNPTSRTAKVRIQLSNASRLRPESFVNVTIRAPMGEQIAVPFDSVLDTGKESWVFALAESGAFEPRLVTIKFHAGDQVAIGSGLVENEPIVTSANFLIDSESRLKGVAAAAAKEGAKPAPQCPPGEIWHAEMKHCMKAPQGE